MTLLDIQERLRAFTSILDSAPTPQSLETVWKIAKLAITRYQFNPTDCVPSSTGGSALVWINPIHQDRYADIECANDDTVRACLSSKEHALLEEWQILDFGIPVIGDRQKTLDESLAYINRFMRTGLLT